MRKLPFLKSALALGIACTSTAGQAADDALQSIVLKPEKIVVTGSRIARTNLVSAAAVTVIDKAAIEAVTRVGFKFEGSSFFRRTTMFFSQLSKCDILKSQLVINIPTYFFDL